MSVHSYSRCWIHLIWGTLHRQHLFDRESAQRLSGFLYRYAEHQGISMPINYVNPDHLHCLIDLPASIPIEQIVKLLKGASSHWINYRRILPVKFAWGRGYGAFSVSQSAFDSVARYIANQGEHHRKKTFDEEYREFIRAYQLQTGNLHDTLRSSRQNTRR